MLRGMMVRRCVVGCYDATSYAVQRSVVASGHATFPVTMIDDLKQRLQAEVERLNHEINFVLPKEIEKARAHGDLRENSEYKAALERQQFAQARASHLRLRLSKLSSVKEEDIPRDRVGFGSRVTVQDVDTKKRNVRPHARRVHRGRRQPRGGARLHGLTARQGPARRPGRADGGDHAAPRETPPQD